MIPYSPLEHFMSNFFAPLSVHSDYSLAKGASKVKALVKKAKALKIPAMALVDEGNMYGAMQFSEYAVEEGIQPIIGVKLFIPLDKKQRGSFTFLAQTATGFANLCSILDLAQRPRPAEDYKGGEGLITLDILEQSDLSDIIVLTGGLDGCLYTLLKEGREEHAIQTLRWFKFFFGNRFYIQIARYGDETAAEKEIEGNLIRIAKEDDVFPCLDEIERGEVPIVASPEVWYASEDRHDAFEILRAVTDKETVNVDNGGVRASSGRRFHLRSPETIFELYADLPHAVENANNIALRCAFQAEFRQPILPPFETEGGRTEAEELRAQSYDGLNARLEKFSISGEEIGKYNERLEYELGIVERMGFPGYFLIVSDFIKWSKANDIPVGPGRGSGAGSLVAWSLQITNINPFDYNLLFERFLNPERVSMPDFDIDFCQDRREEVIHYVQQKYGADHVSLIATFGEIKAKTAIRDFGRVLLSDDFGKIHIYDVDRLAKLVSMEGAETKTIEFSMEDPGNPDFRQMVESEPKFGVLAKGASNIEGLYRQQGTHAAGVVIGGQPLHTLVPIGYDVNTGMSVSQYNMKFAEKAGLVKFDFLGLKTLSVIKETLRTIKDTTGEDVDIDLIPMDDAETYQMLAEGQSNGVFQVESEGMKKALKQIKPTKIDDLIAVGALFRPGPMEMIPLYAEVKNGLKQAEYPEPVSGTKPFLEETFGIIVYQEQVMELGRVVAGYSLGGADLLRRAMGKKIKEEMDQQRVLFVEGAQKNGHAAKDAGALFDTIAKFANYGFNKSHAAAYGVISYQTAYLKKKYPAHFFAALLTYDADKPEKMAMIKEDMDAFGIRMLLPDVSRSQAAFKPERLEDGSFGVRFGLKAIKKVAGDMHELIDAQKDGEFKSLEDFHTRVGHQFDKAKKEKLAEAGAFDRLNENRAQTVSILSFLGKGKKDTAQTDLFGNSIEIQIPGKVKDVAEWGNRADREFEAVGFYFGVHPLDLYQAKFERLKVKRKDSLIAFMREKKMLDLPPPGGELIRMAGLVEFHERKKSQNGSEYLSAKIQERKASFFVRFFAPRNGGKQVLDEWEATLVNAKVGRRPVIIESRVRLQEGFSDLSVFGQKIIDAETLVAQERGKLLITLDRDAIRLSVDEQKRVAAMHEDVKLGKLRQEQVPAIEQGIRTEAMGRKAKELIEFMNSLRNDTAPNAVPVIVSLKVGEQISSREMSARYVVDLAAETTLKSMDGITSVQEFMGKPEPVHA
jgi:DNA polymerase-3 subunit alpha